MKYHIIKKSINKKFIFVSVIIFFLYVLSNINKFYNNNELLWNNERINVNETQKEIIKYENITKCYNTIKHFNLIDKPKISLIIPVFNQQKYLIPFYCSINNQTFENIEIIFIDDASTDNSSKIIKEFKKKDKRIKYFKNKNK
jgi:glycosyltransferase involved in cell wall biosynthesis